ncbi:MAG: hypothetical protein ACRER8_15360 [Pseudomonas sp.]|uniref:hypothetical protein n=1 Tax=Pseudomonas sp. TaxID=306 RepID=UPI003D6E4CCD
MQKVSVAICGVAFNHSTKIGAPLRSAMGVCLRGTMALFNSAPLSVDSSTIEQ